MNETWLEDALRAESVIARYRAKIHLVPGSDCLWWTGAICGAGHGRFWVKDTTAIIAHRLAYALAYGTTALGQTPLVAHKCDNPLCQNPTHLLATTSAENRRQWAQRRHQIKGSLRDTRGARGRAHALRQAILEQRDLDTVVAAGYTTLDAHQDTLW